MRLFIAFLLSDEVRESLRSVRRALVRFDRQVRWTPAEQMHVTVQFLGEVPDRDVVGVTDGLIKAGGMGVPFDMDVGGVGCFPPRGPVRVVWVGARDDSGSMKRTVEAVHGAMEALGVPRESRPWTGHITIGRVREDRTGSAMRDAITSCQTVRVRQRVEAVVLMSSVLSPHGARYSVVQSVPLG